MDQLITSLSDTGVTTFLLKKKIKCNNPEKALIGIIEMLTDFPNQGELNL